ncbi:hypothetical protein K2173_021372 [Erythroxylum novogranatense]|uniref:ZF-HD dimerization-type domain-containing protein n=1 Tax=Erythroxylum novogranatense TaxID=1862640 RepID=A0AAV8TUW2_9ROSI|nr:hypothetical protein K2173_021372 [Erythroxylum novogranatense]
MALRGQDKAGMPGSLFYNPMNRDSPSKVPSASIVPGLSERRKDHQSATTQILDQQGHILHQSQKTTRDTDQSTDPIPVPESATTVTTSAINADPTPSRSISRSPPPTLTTPAISYRECLKNHAATMGGHVVDGCGEFMASGEEGKPESLRCAACGCHRNFHRKEIDGAPNYLANSHHKNNSQITALPHHHLHHQQVSTSLPQPQSSFHQHLRQYLGTTPTAPIMMTFGGAAAESSSEDLDIFRSNLQVQASIHPSSSSKKRFRTKFSHEQKEKMMEFAEKLEWKIQKQNENEVQQFCSQLGVKRKVFKVWMHNNKQAMKKKQLEEI